MVTKCMLDLLMLATSPLQAAFGMNESVECLTCRASGRKPVHGQVYRDSDGLVKTEPDESHSGTHAAWTSAGHFALTASPATAAGASKQLDSPTRRTSKRSRGSIAPAMPTYTAALNVNKGSDYNAEYSPSGLHKKLSYASRNSSASKGQHTRRCSTAKRRLFGQNDGILPGSVLEGAVDQHAKVDGQGRLQQPRQRAAGPSKPQQSLDDPAPSQLWGNARCDTPRSAHISDSQGSGRSFSFHGSDASFGSTAQAELTAAHATAENAPSTGVTATDVTAENAPSTGVTATDVLTAAALTLPASATLATGPLGTAEIISGASPSWTPVTVSVAPSMSHAAAVSRELMSAHHVSNPLPAVVSTLAAVVTAPVSFSTLLETVNGQLGSQCLVSIANMQTNFEDIRNLFGTEDAHLVKTLRHVGELSSLQALFVSKEVKRLKHLHQQLQHT